MSRKCVISATVTFPHIFKKRCCGGDAADCKGLVSENTLRLKTMLYWHGMKSGPGEGNFLPGGFNFFT